MSKPTPIQFTVRLSPELRKRLEYIAGREVRSLSQQIEKFALDSSEAWCQQHLGGEWPEILQAWVPGDGEPQF